MSRRIKAHPRQGREIDMASRALAEYQEAQRRRERWVLERAVVDLQRHIDGTNRTCESGDEP